MKSVERYERQLAEFRDRRAVYRHAAKRVAVFVEEACDAAGVYPMIAHRAKSLESFSEKIRRPGKRYRNPLDTLTDLAGVRAVVHTHEEVDRVRAEIESTAVDAGFAVDPGNSVSARERLRVREFGYLSEHLVLSLSERGCLPPETLDAASRIPSIRVELQLRTIAQHAWAAVFHEAGYKNEFHLTYRMDRDFARAAALLEQCDEIFSDVTRRLDDLSAEGYDGYMSKAERQALARRLRSYERVAPGDVKVLEKLVRAYRSLAKWQEMIDLFDANRDVLAEIAPVVRDIGVAYHKRARRKGDTRAEAEDLDRAAGLIERALEIDQADVDARASLGGVARSRGDLERAREHYLQALRHDPSNPYALGNYIVLQARQTKSMEHLAPMRAAVLGAAERCDEQIGVRANLPWAWFDKAQFQLCLGEWGAALATYRSAKAGLGDGGHETREWMIGTHLRALSDLDGLGVDGLDRCKRFLREWRRALRRRRGAGRRAAPARRAAATGQGN